MKNPRRRAREIALQALYAWQLGGGSAAEAVAQAQALEGYERADAALVETLVRGGIERAEALDALIAPHLIERRPSELSPIERAILRIGTLELSEQPETPVKVVLNEAIELGKDFGAAQGHRFVNGVLERVAQAVRPGEFARLRQTA
ncbi:MAG: transcription antitermination factor NusB [Betaproteobacteria bacterium]|nr:transcription antitermination factor NusB [Betaproteobacteria bacterium]